MFIAESKVSFYEAQESVLQSGANLLTIDSIKANFSLINDLGITGTYWTGTRITCSQQAVVEIKGGKIVGFTGWDKTFKAGFIYEV